MMRPDAGSRPPLVRLWRAVAVVSLLAAASLPRGARSATAPAGPAEKTALGVEPQATTVAADSPRAAVAEYLSLCQQGRFEEAARYLDLPDASRSAELARKLKSVLDQAALLDLERISPSSLGREEDTLPAGVDDVTVLHDGPGAAQPVRMSRHLLAEGPRWQFSRNTVERIDAWYERLPDRWMLEHLPAPLLKTGPLNLLAWQWLAMPLVLLLALLTGYLASRLARSILGRLAARTETKWDDIILERTASPITVTGALAAIYLYSPLLSLNERAEVLLDRGLRAGFFVVFFWFLLRFVDVGVEGLAVSSWAKDHPASRSLVPLGARVVKLLILGMAVIAVLSEFGFPVASLVAGLGIGGLALALAAQKTVENLFGAFSLGVDQPFREGDFVRIDDVTGTVEAIGLRSTRLRTLDRTLVSIPNGKLAEKRIETFAARDRIRLTCTLNLTYATSAAQMRRVLAAIEQRLLGHPKIWPDVAARFVAMAADSLTIEINAWFKTVDWNEFLTIRQDLLLDFMQIVEDAGASFAFPTRTLHLMDTKECRCQTQSTT
jgi:MscS family membrane protein